MPRFKHKRNGQIIDVSEEHANQVVRKKAVYEEISEEEPSENPAPSELKAHHRGFGKWDVRDSEGNMVDGTFESREEAESWIEENM